MNSLNETKTQLNKQPLVAIIGTAGRDMYTHNMDALLFQKMINKAKDVIQNEWNLPLSQIHAVSGGAAWSDHVAVKLFVQSDIPNLTLHFPCRWNPKIDMFEDNSNVSWKTNPGGLANEYHQRYHYKTRECSLDEIRDAIRLGATIKVHKGFHQRNTEVARADYLLAFSWAEGSEPTDGGTLNTWNKSKGIKFHVPLSSL